MINAVIKGLINDVSLLETGIKNEAAFSTNESVTVARIYTEKELNLFLQKKENADIICVDVSVLHGVEQAERLRTVYPSAAIIVVADVQMSPISYMKPSIMAAALLLKPLVAEGISPVIQAVFRKFIHEVDRDEVFVLQTREEKQRLPYASILYFEARTKKVYACTENCEYGFYDTIDHLEEILSEHFVKCHRSYLVNRRMIEKVKLSQNYLVLRGNIEIPLSRSCKGAIKELRA